tara:strand:- start:1699 stop:2187 length:489 start_codon:yes stop_codon:yes gene_type:complete
MNIFYLDRNARECAKAHCDKHVVKMILETAQLLSTAHRIIDGDRGNEELYKTTHKNHPSAIWVRESFDHYHWTFRLFKYLCEEYTKRYTKVHATARLLHLLSEAPFEIGVKGFTPPPQCMPDECKLENTKEAYRNYYMIEKSYMAVWKHSPVPEWFSYPVTT